MKRTLLLLPLLCALQFFTASAAPPRVVLTNGVFEGTERRVPGSYMAIEQYYGIPFARVPRRFAAAKPVGRRRNNLPISAKKPPKTCYQVRYEFFKTPAEDMWNNNTPMSEDCLFLNIWRPVNRRIRNRPRERRLPILVWIFGGGYVQGSAVLDLYNGAVLASREEVILITVGQRLGSFAYLMTKDPTAPPNVGVRDQELALKYIHDNIHYLGGKPGSVTLFGESAGASMIGHLMIRKNPYFDRAVLQSASPTSPWGYTTRAEARRRTKLLAKKLKCLRKSDTAMVRCLRRLPAKKIQDNDWLASGSLMFTWNPIVDGHYIKESPVMSLRRGNFRKIPLMLGSNAQEGWFWILYEFMNMRKMTGKQAYKSIAKPKQFRKMMDHNLMYYPRWPVKASKKFHKALTHLYYPRRNPMNKKKVMQAMNDALADRNFVCSVNEMASAAARRGAPVYKYYFDVLTRQKAWPKWMGVLHGDEIQYFFGIPLRDGRGRGKYTKVEKDVSALMMNYLANFARKGDPNPIYVSRQRPRWPRFINRHKRVYHFRTSRKTRLGEAAGKYEFKVRGEVQTKQCGWWDRKAPRL